MPIGIPTLCDHDPDVWLLSEEAVAELVVPKGSLDHKRSVGTVLVVGGSKGMEGAAHMAAIAALRSGAGLVHAALPDGAGAEKPFAEVITVTVPGGDGQFGLAARAALFEQAAQLKAVAVGPGLGRADEAQLLVRELLAVDRPLLLDADGLYALGDKLELLAGRTEPTVHHAARGRAGPPHRPLRGRASRPERLECARAAAAARERHGRPQG